MRRSFAILALIAGMSLVATLDSRAQYSISWYKIAGGGGTSANGAYSVSGTIGQPDAGQLSGGPYTLTGGFWAMIQTVQTIGAPYLSIATTNSNHAVLSWPVAATGFVLQQDANLNSTNWSNVNTNTFPIVVSNGTNYVTVPINPGNQFFRLVNP